MKYIITIFLCLAGVGAVLAQTSSHYNVKDFGATGDGQQSDRRAIQAAIDTAFAVGGGRVIIPPGRYLSGSIVLKSNITFELQAGATLIGSGQLEDYQQNPGFDPHGSTVTRRYLLSAIGAKNVTLCGKGTVDGNGQAFWEPTTDTLRFIRAKLERPDALLEIADSENVTIRDITMVHSAKWTCHLLHSSNIMIEGVNIFSNLMAPNSDGIDISGCQQVRISNCNISTGDDAIVIKTWKNGQVSEDITVINCNLMSLCAALKLGTESYQDFRRITFSNCTVRNSSRLFAIYVRDGATVENISISNLIGDTNAPLVLNRPLQLMITRRKADSPLGTIRNVFVDQLLCKTEGRILMTADPGGTIENVYLSKIHLDYPFIEDPTPVASQTQSNQYPQNLPEARAAKAAMVAYNIKNLNVQQFSINWPGSAIPKKWQLPLRLENGSFSARHRYDYQVPKQTELSAFWGRKLTDGEISAKRLSASSDKIATFDIDQSTIKTNTIDE